MMILQSGYHETVPCPGLPVATSRTSVHHTIVTGTSVTHVNLDNVGTIGRYSRRNDFF